MSRRVLVSCALAAVAAASTSLAAGPHALDEELPGPRTASTAFVVQQLTHWPKGGPLAERPDAGGLTLTCLEAKGEPDTVGVAQVLTVDAGLAEVVALIDDFAHYTKLFPDLADVHVVKGSEDGNRFGVFTEQIVPVFFLPNIKFENTYLVERTPGRVSYRYQLKAKGDLKAVDGLMVFEALDDGRTRYTEFDFVEGAWGLVPRDTVWKETVDGFARSDWSLKLKAEHPGWTYPQVRKAADAEAAKSGVAWCAAHRVARGSN